MEVATLNVSPSIRMFANDMSNIFPSVKYLQIAHVTLYYRRISISI